MGSVWLTIGQLENTEKAFGESLCVMKINHFHKAREKRDTIRYGFNKNLPCSLDYGYDSELNRNNYKAISNLLASKWFPRIS